MRIPTSLHIVTILALLVGILNAYDAISTVYGLSMGAVEINPLFNGNYVFKLSLVPFLFALTALLWKVVDKKTPHWSAKDINEATTAKKFMSCLWITLATLFGVLAINNTIITLKIWDVI
jgi:hypothetical protein